jgi:hypothetical protein
MKILETSSANPCQSVTERGVPKKSQWALLAAAARASKRRIVKVAQPVFRLVTVKKNSAREPLYSTVVRMYVSREVPFAVVVQLQFEQRIINMSEITRADVAHRHSNLGDTTNS